MASKRRLRRNACGGKARHRDAEGGKVAIGILNRTRGYQGQMDVYKCQWCGWYHIGHSKRHQVT